MEQKFIDLIATGHADATAKWTITKQNLIKSLDAGAVRAARNLDVMATYEGNVAAWQAFLQVTLETPVENVRAHLVSLAFRSPDDTWSGRNNDAKRSFMDGWRETLQAISQYVA